MCKLIDKLLPARASQPEPTPKGTRAEHLPWPRKADDGTPLGIDLGKIRSPLQCRPGERPRVTAYEEMRRIVIAGKFAVRGYEPDEIVQEVALIIARRNHMPSAFDPRKSGFAHYIHILAKNQCINLSIARRGNDELTDDGELPDDRDEREVAADLLQGREAIEDLITEDPQAARALLKAIEVAMAQTLPKIRAAVVA
jgi:DNA-directed RNA polymerase specialized sigma24 family protein